MEGNAMEEEQNTETREVSQQASADGAHRVHRETVSRSTTVPSSVVAQRIIWYIAGVIIAFLAARIILLLLAANQGSGFVDFIYSVGGFFAAPFYGIFNYTPHYGKFYFEISSVVAIIVYALIAWGLAALFTITKRRSAVE